MKKLNPAIKIGSLILLCLIFLGTKSSIAENIPNITNVQVSPDLSHVIVRSDGPLGKCNAFVMEKPSRLVIDFEGTALGAMPSKIRVGREPLDEIRLGYNNSRARMVMDFGSNAVPEYGIDRREDFLVVALVIPNSGSSEATPESGTNLHKPGSKSVKSLMVPIIPVAGKDRQDKKRQEKNVHAEKAQKDFSVSHPPAKKIYTVEPTPLRTLDPPITLKTAGVDKDGLVYVELNDKKTSGRTARLEIELDPVRLTVRKGVVKDSSGRVTRFDLTSNDGRESRLESSRKLHTGPRRNASLKTLSRTQEDTPLSPAPANIRYQDASISEQPASWPLKLQEYRLEARTTERRD
jgi:hypothetical protein